MELKSIIIQTNKQKLLEGLNNRFEQAEKRMSKLEDRSIEIFEEVIAENMPNLMKKHSSTHPRKSTNSKYDKCKEIFIQTHHNHTIKGQRQRKKATGVPQ